ncbi:hypothetical protein IRJ41_021104, partial [Triplophysa rosa]
AASRSFDVQNPPSSQRRLAAGAEEEADGPRQDAANLTSLFTFQVLRFNQSSPHKLLWSTFEIRTLKLITVPTASASQKVSLPCQEVGELHKEIWATGKPAAVSIKVISHLSGHLPPAPGPIIPLFEHLHLINRSSAKEHKAWLLVPIAGAAEQLLLKEIKWSMSLVDKSKPTEATSHIQPTIQCN